MILYLIFFVTTFTFGNRYMASIISVLWDVYCPCPCLSIIQFLITCDLKVDIFEKSLEFLAYSVKISIKSVKINSFIVKIKGFSTNIKAFHFSSVRKIEICFSKI